MVTVLCKLFALCQPSDSNYMLQSDVKYHERDSHLFPSVLSVDSNRNTDHISDSVESRGVTPMGKPPH